MIDARNDAAVREAPAACATAGELRIGDRVTWLAGWNYGEPSVIIDVREWAAFPGYVEVTEEPEIVHSHYFMTRRLRKDRLVARLLARAVICRACGKPILATTPPRCWTGEHCRCTPPAAACASSAGGRPAPAPPAG